MNKLLIGLLTVVTFICYTSCKKNEVLSTPDLPDNSIPIMGFRDSTQLIKSIRENSYDSATNRITDTTTTYFYYDTVNRKISLKLKGYSYPDQAFRDSFELSYNSSGLLIQFANKSTQVDPTSSNILTEDITYDADNIVKTVTENIFDGRTLTYNMNKTSLANGGYSLNWFDLRNEPSIDYYTVNFDKSGRANSYYHNSNSDSIIYDAAGNMSKILRTKYFPLPDVPYTYVLYDFVSRSSKGDQLYNLNRILYNGLYNFPAQTSFGMMDEFDYQYFKYPALSTNVYRFPNGYGTGGVGYTINFSSTPQYDSQNRLVKYRVFFDDIPFTYMEYVISYYK